MGLRAGTNFGPAETDFGHFSKDSMDGNSRPWPTVRVWMHMCRVCMTSVQVIPCEMSHALYCIPWLRVQNWCYTDDVKQKSKHLLHHRMPAWSEKVQCTSFLQLCRVLHCKNRSTSPSPAEVCTKGRGFGRQPKSAHHKFSVLILWQVAQLPNCRICLVDISLHICQPCARLNRQCVKTPQQIWESLKRHLPEQYHNSYQFLLEDKHELM